MFQGEKRMKIFNEKRFCNGEVVKKFLLFAVTLSMLSGNTVSKLKLYFTKVEPSTVASITFGVLIFITPITNSIERHLVAFAKKQGVDLNTDMIAEVDHLHLVYHPRHRHQYKGNAQNTKGIYYIKKRKVTRHKNKK